MLGGLFKQAQDKSVAGKERARGDGERSRSPPDGHRLRAPEQLVQPSSRPSFERGVTTAVSTPHDAVLAELFPHRPGPIADRPETAPETPEVAPRKDEAGTSHHRSQSPGRTPLHDPFAGSLIGHSILDDGDQARNDRTNFEARKEDLWSHMTNIRDIQTQIANMHVAMENIGLGHQVDQLSVERMHSTVPSEGEKREDAIEDDEAKEKDAREQEFTKLASKFHERKEATENIMTKLDELSRVVTAFHALRIPVVDFYGSRSNSKAEGLSAGELGAQGLEPPLIIIPPPREQQQGQQQSYVQSPMPVWAGSLGERDGSGG